MLRFLCLVLHTQTYAGDFPTLHWLFTQPCFHALPLSVGLHSHCAPKAGCCLEVKIVPQVGVLLQ